MLVFGTRPEAIKMSPLVLALQRCSDIRCVVCVTGQHREMLDQVLELYSIKPDYDLNIMKSSQSLNDITCGIINGLKPILEEAVPDLVLVHGDTTTAMASALAAFYARIPVGHIEAGLRTYNLKSPWPEEMNRQVISRLADVHFAPTERCKHNLLDENVQGTIFVTGNTVIDALNIISNRLAQSDTFRAEIYSRVLLKGYDLNRVCEGQRLIVVTGHRRENYESGLANMCLAISQLANDNADVDIVLPMHLSPTVRGIILEKIHNNSYHNIFLLEPLDYAEFVFMMTKAYLILTDSGGIQEEAPTFKKPVLVMRNTTEREEALECGAVELVGTDVHTIVSKVQRLMVDRDYYNSFSKFANPYGDGKSCEKITNYILNK